MDIQQQKHRKTPWKRWLILLVVLTLLLVLTVLSIVDSQGPWITILPGAIIAFLSVIIGLLQWLFPIASEIEHHSVPHTYVSPMPQGVAVNPSPPNAHILAPTTQSLVEPILSPTKTAYRSIVSIPPPTDPRTIQQRDTAVKEVYVRLLQPDITAIALTGIGGVGKSTLAALIYRYAEEQRRAGNGPFTAEALWLKIDSSAVTMTDLAGTIFDALRKPLPDMSNLAPQNQAVTLFNVLNTVNGTRLIVLDQFENLLDWQTGYALPDRPGVGEWLDAMNSQSCTCRILLTCRPWPQGIKGYPPTYMQEYYVKGLEVPEGVELLQKLKVEGAEQELRTAVERCTGHAFALTLLALLLRKRSLHLSAFFKDATYTQVWTGNVARNLLDSIYAQQLDGLQRKLLVAFSVYREPMPLDAALTVAADTSDVSRRQMQYALDGLLAQHLLQASGDGRYQLHTIVADYARHHFDTSNEQANRQAVRAAHTRAAQYYQQRAMLECPPQEQRRQASDVQPLIEAAWQLCQAEQWREAYRLMQQEAIFVDLERWGGYAILLELYQLLPPPDTWHLEPSQAAHLYNHWGEVYRSLGQRERARECFERALYIGQTAGERKEEGWALNNLGRIEAGLERKERGLKYYERALEIFQAEKDADGESNTLTNLGWVYYDLGMLQPAQEHYEQALNIRHEVKDRLGEAASLNSLGRVYANLGQLEQARTYHEQALHICKEIGHRSGEAWALNNLGRVYSALGDKHQALDYLQRALTIRREIGNRSGEAATLTNLGGVYLDLGEKEQARDCLELALPIRREVGDRNGEAKTLINLGKVYTELGKKEAVLLYYRQALSICRELGQSKREARVLNKIGLLSIEQRRYDLALACFLLARDLLATLQSSDAENKLRDNVALSHIDDLHEKVGDEQFGMLMAQVEPKAREIVEEAMHEEPK